MNEQFLIAAIASGIALVASIAAVLVARGARRRIQSANALAEGLKEGFVAKSSELNELTRRHEELAMRVARLESARARGAVVEAPAEELAPTGEKKLTITERRHRVIQLTRRGQDAQTIATLLGIPRGEVDLIIGLHRAA